MLGGTLAPMACCALLLPVAAPAAKYVYGPPPAWSRFRTLGELAVKAALPGYANPIVSWSSGFSPLGHGFGDKSKGYLSCGVVEMATEVGGTRRQPFAIVIDYDQVKQLKIAKRENDSAAIVCRLLMERGMLPPVSLMTANEEVQANRIGLSLRQTGEGAVVVGVMPGSAAEAAGIVPGSVIKRANGITLSGLGSSLAPVLDAMSGEVLLDTGSGPVRVDLK